ncbi:GntR family transcriptional regulator [Pseudorhodoferax sp. Leaf274]|uniref:GntR family transcriptional regulator n=1 Tax=Pseudorhodoferax sp. Leaf274 TaxID=1736318 RepID=UPI00070309CB|nr:GntR family transcriptional regulator [Pseudorhodoferax sp. Leaf274]KQP49129.1 GntR family transcriptional regulator [Pseudorhodoferax sp. Leaf274]
MNSVTLDAGVGRQPMYAALATVLVRDIEEGRYPPESTLPSEKELGERYGVSRHTVRQALREVRDRGLISSQSGVGTIVRSGARGSLFRAVNSVESLLQFVETTEMHALSRSEVKVDEALAQQLGFAKGLLLSQASFVRKTHGETLPMSYLLIYVPPRFAAAQDTPVVSSSPIYKNIERLYGVRVHEIQQDITATSLNQELADILQAAPGTAALEIRRFYYDQNETLLQATVSYYPAGRYIQSGRFRATANMTG